MTATPKIRPLLGLTSLSDNDLINRCAAVLKGLTGNADYPAPPVDLTVFETALTTFAADIAAALDGGQKAIAVKNKQRDVVILMVRQLAIYVEVACNGDMVTFTSSGFQAASTVRVPAPPLTQPDIRKIEQGATGVLMITITSIAGAKSYDVRYAVLTAGTPGAWAIETVTKVKPALSINGLAPGTTYAFQVRALGKTGYTGWSDSATRMSI